MWNKEILQRIIVVFETQILLCGSTNNQRNIYNSSQVEWHHSSNIFDPVDRSLTASNKKNNSKKVEKKKTIFINFSFSRAIVTGVIGLFFRNLFYFLTWWGRDTARFLMIPLCFISFILLYLYMCWLLMKSKSFPNFSL